VSRCPAAPPVTRRREVCSAGRGLRCRRIPGLRQPMAIGARLSWAVLLRLLMAQHAEVARPRDSLERQLGVAARPATACVHLERMRRRPGRGQVAGCAASLCRMVVRVTGGAVDLGGGTSEPLRVTARTRDRRVHVVPEGQRPGGCDSDGELGRSRERKRLLRHVRRGVTPRAVRGERRLVVAGATVGERANAHRAVDRVDGMTGEAVDALMVLMPENGVRLLCADVRSRAERQRRRGGRTDLERKRGRRARAGWPRRPGEREHQTCAAGQPSRPAGRACTHRPRWTGFAVDPTAHSPGA
jgi:hypothetical protein